MNFKLWEVDKRLQINDPNKKYYFNYISLHYYSKDFIREFRNNIYWNFDSKQYIKCSCGEKFFKELFGND